MNEAKRVIRSRTSTMTTAVVAKAATRSIKVSKTAIPAKGKTLYHFHQIPGGGLLRALFVAYIVAQVGSIKANVPFRLWPSMNTTTHVKSGRMKRAGKGTYTLTQPGVNYLTSDEQKADKAQVAGFIKAVKSGEKPAFHKYELSEMKA